MIDDEAYLRAWGYTSSPSCRASELWAHILDRAGVRYWADPQLAPLDMILRRGTLAERIAETLGHQVGEVPRAQLAAVYGQLCVCLATGRMYGQTEA